MDKKTITCTEDLKKRFRSFKHTRRNRIIQRITKISRWILIIFAIIFALLFIAYNFVFQNYEVIGENLECKTNTPFQFNYTCKLEIIDNVTQYWSFESKLPDGFSLPRMMVRNQLFVFSVIQCHVKWSSFLTLNVLLLKF